ncbi:hypothetical protein L3X38_032300 [Prunus dulcis]|uniref:Uncharacterized protein n=1 Tax=Prunus dulcis TaxID=3755 RepID=A0AAD4YWH5_PRUDU|nr:hypothetical protein L3X38_032300 [Prunus dulcis]
MLQKLLAGGRRKEVSRDLLRAERVLGTALVTPANLPPLVLWDLGVAHYILCVVENILVETSYKQRRF